MSLMKLFLCQELKFDNFIWLMSDWQLLSFSISFYFTKFKPFVCKTSWITSSACFFLMKTQSIEKNTWFVVHIVQKYFWNLSYKLSNKKNYNLYRSLQKKSCWSSHVKNSQLKKNAFTFVPTVLTHLNPFSSNVFSENYIDALTLTKCARKWFSFRISDITNLIDSGWVTHKQMSRKTNFKENRGCSYYPFVVQITTVCDA